jgi:predicted RNA binding protein YcfA (HicA-like mRNA interferase family)
MNPRALLARLARGSFQNVRFGDAQRLVTALGFRLARTEGSHRIFTHADISELLNLQEVGGDAKAYQLRQLLRLVERYNLQLKKDS